MKKKIFLIFCINVFCLSPAAEVTQITIKGNKHTEDAIIIREIHHPIPGEFVKSVAEEDRNRIYNLGIFSTVEVTQNGSNYQVSVVEGPRWIPFPIIDYNEAKGKEGWSYGLGLKLLNFRGINETVDLGLTFGDVNNYFLELYDPWIAGNHISFGASISDQTNSHAYYNFRFTQQEVALITGFYVRRVHKFNAYIGYDHRIVKWNDIDDSQGASVSNLTDDHLFSGMNYDFDTRDIYIDPKKGQQIGFEINFNSGLKNSTDFTHLRLWANFWFLLINNSIEPVISIKSVANLQFSDQLPIYRNLFLGGEDYVRGYSPIPTDNPNDVVALIESQNIFYQSLSYQQTLFPRIDYNGMELGIDWHVFFDWGIGSDSNHRFRISRNIYGYGAGLIFYASGLGAIGIDFGYNPYEPDTHIHLSSSN